MQTKFSGFHSLTEGSIFFLDGLRIGRTLFNGIEIENCSTSESLFYLGGSIANTISIAVFKNIKGRILRIAQSSIVVIQNLTIINLSCLNQEYFQTGGIFYLESLSSLNFNIGLFINITNIVSPGAFFLENSNFTVANLKMQNVNSNNGYFLTSLNCNVTMLNSSFAAFRNGGFFIEKSSFSINMTNFFNNGTYNDKNMYGSVLHCHLCRKLFIDNCVFMGNKNNSVDGGVIFLISLT